MAGVFFLPLLIHKEGAPLLQEEVGVVHLKGEIACPLTAVKRLTSIKSMPVFKSRSDY
jgi:hypothetical protein